MQEEEVNSAAGGKVKYKLQDGDEVLDYIFDEN